MAGWTKREDASSVEESVDDNTLNIQRPEGFPDFESCYKKAKALFDEFIATFLKEVFGSTCFRPLPPVIGLGQEVDLFELHVVVRKRGGYSTVSENGSWSLVATDCGFGSESGSALRLVYAKYLETLDRWLRKIHPKDKLVEYIGDKEEYQGFIWPSMELESDLKVFLSDKVKKEEFSLFVDLEVDAKSVHGNGGGNVKLDKGGGNDDVDVAEDSVSRKRKRMCDLGMLRWIREVAKDPCDGGIESLPERHKWKCYGAEMEWKQILFVREGMLLKKNLGASSPQSGWQKKLKMHPSMYNDDQWGSERLRCSQRLVSAKASSQKLRERLVSESSSSGFHSDEDITDISTDDSVNFCATKRRTKRVPIGPNCQAELPELSVEDYYESQPKWWGTKIWPLEKVEQKKSLIERDPIGKGRQESCGCEFPGSVECVQFHIREKKPKLKLELGSAYYKWKFDFMGEIVRISWAKEDECKFQEIVASNRLSSEKYFWDELFKYFSKKNRETLVSYYFNVFLLRRRGCQNRSGGGNIDSDDEDSEYGPIGDRFGQVADKSSPVSIFCSPKKSHASVR